ncbi:hypothetical protein CspeluHIS016_0302070 [Cutaneotrichosporon spelunceum]|uniref:Protein BIG1 n=1 Tax=Cutaneotrichosporon spelunceum TaxID=1672016 RepID=A0AAD3TTQ8_9TREE|nr:hypothetical protein CspeluHIS016_0302070 [Cutaneotrichosporon spelunceum]
MRFLTVGASSALLLASAAAAFRDSSPLLVWSSEPNYGLDEARAELTSGVIGADAVFGSLETIGCDWDMAVVVRMDELHQTQIKKISLPLDSSKADLHIPYLIRPTREALDTSVQSWAENCGAELIDDSATPEKGQRTLVYIHAEHGKDIALPQDLPARNIVVVTGTRDLSKHELKRQEVAEEPFESVKVPEVVASLPSLSPEPNASAAAKNETDPDAPKRKHNTYFTTPLITAILITFGVFIPIVFLSVKALASVQVPPRLLEISKALAVDKTRKDQ